MRISKPSGIFRGVNFITPDPVEYHKIHVHGRVIYVEIAEGEDFDHNPIYGVTFRFATGERLDADLGRVFSSLDKAREYITALSQGR